MSKKRKRLDNKQLSLLDLVEKIKAREEVPPEGSLDVKNQFQGAIVNAIKHSPLSRWEIAGKMSALLGVEITKYMLDAWTAESKDGHRMPGIYIPAFCVATQDYAAVKLLAEKCGVFILPGVEVLRAELAKVITRRDEENRKIKRIRLLLSEIEKETEP